MTRIAVLADTHLRRGSSRRLPEPAWDHLRRADLIVHAGDVLIADLLDELGAVAPTVAVLGNNDHELRGVLPEERSVEVDGVQLAVVHDAGPKAGRPGRMRRRFPGADVVVFGHSHQPVDEPGVDGQRLFNPGSPTERRRALHHTMGILETAGGRLTRHEIVRV